MFLLPSIAVGIGLALLLGGRPSHLLTHDFHRPWAVFLAVAIQVAVFAPWGEGIPKTIGDALYLVSYAFLFAFAAANIRALALVPLFAGMSLNALVIGVNGGTMPLSDAAAQAAGIRAGANVGADAGTLGFLGDVFAIPAGIPLANVFSVGDVLIALGVVTFVLSVSLGRPGSERALDPRRLLRPLTVPSFRRLAAGKLVSHLGDWLTLAALVGWIYGETGSTGQVALLLVVRLAPPILGGGVAAAVVDRLRKERLLVSVEIMRGLTLVGAIVAVTLSLEPLAFAAVAVSGGLAAVSAATTPALVPSLLDAERLPAANALLGVAQDVAMAVGALGAGIALTLSGAVIALVLDLGTFVVAAWLYWGIRVRPQPVEPESAGILAGLRYLLGRRSLLLVVGAFSAATLATGLTNATLPRFLDTELGLGPAAYGFGLSALAWGLACGQALVGVARVGEDGARWIGVALLAMGGLFVAFATGHHAATAMLVLVLIGVVDGTTDVLFDTVVQREADQRFYGRVFGFSSAFFTTTMMAAVAAAPLANRLANPQLVVLTAGLLLSAAAAVALVPIRRSAARATILPARVGSR
jgi:hypothetical protein